MRVTKIEFYPTIYNNKKYSFQNNKKKKEQKKDDSQFKEILYDTFERSDNEYPKKNK